MLGVLLGLVALGVAAAAITVATVRRPTEPVPDLDGYLERWSVLHGGYDPRAGARVVRVWLGAAHRLGRPLAGAGVGPDAVTAWTVPTAYAAVAAAAAGGRWALAGAAALAVSLVLDGLDGCVAVLADRASRFGFVLDSLVDRICDALALVALWRLGAPAALAVAAGAGLGLLEYVRARAGNAGMGEIGVVTVGERPMRVAAAAGGLLAAGLLPSYAAAATTAGAATVAALTGVGLAQLLRAVHRTLS